MYTATQISLQLKSICRLFWQNKCIIAQKNIQARPQSGFGSFLCYILGGFQVQHSLLSCCAVFEWSLERSTIQPPTKRCTDPGRFSTKKQTAASPAKWKRLRASRGCRPLLVSFAYIYPLILCRTLLSVLSWVYCRLFLMPIHYGLDKRLCIIVFFMMAQYRYCIARGTI